MRLSFRRRRRRRVGLPRTKDGYARHACRTRTTRTHPILTAPPPQMEKANRRIRTLAHDLKKIRARVADDDDSDDDDDDDLNETEAVQAELEELKSANAARQDKLDTYEKNKTWNVDNMFAVTEERTVINPTAGQNTYTDSGFVEPKDEELKPKAKAVAPQKPAPKTSTTKSAAKATLVGPAPIPEHTPPPVEVGAFETYAQFTDKYAETVELFMAIPDLERTKEFLLKFADVVLQENSSNYLLLASLEDEMNGHREKMKRTARQSQIITNIAELAKTLKTHPGNVIMPFFSRLEQREHLEEFLKGVKDFQEKIVKRAVVKKAEIDAERAAEAAKDLSEIPLEERLGPGGLDPLEVIETLPEGMVKAFESRDVEELKAVLMTMPPEEAQRHMERCVASGLWVG